MTWEGSMRRPRLATLLFPETAPAASDAQRLRLICDQLRQQLLNRMQILRGEAVTIAADMDALVARLEQDGYAAMVDDIRSARWYKTKHEFLVIRDIYMYCCDLVGVEPGPVALVEDPESGGVPSEVDD